MNQPDPTTDPETARLHDEILTGRAEIAQLRDLLGKENQRANDAINREETAEQAAIELGQEVRRLGLTVSEYGQGASALTDKLRRARTMHRETCPLATGKAGAGFSCSMCELLDAPAAPVVPPAPTSQTAPLLRDAEAYLSALHGSVARHDNLAAGFGCAGCALRDRIAAEEQPDNETPPVDLPTLAALFEGFGNLLATSSRDWGTYRVDAWLYAVILGWDCEQDVHDDTCTHGAMEEMQQMHGWSDEAVAKARRYRAVVRELTAPPAVVPQPEEADRG